MAGANDRSDEDFDDRNRRPSPDEYDDQRRSTGVVGRQSHDDANKLRTNEDSGRRAEQVGDFGGISTTTLPLIIIITNLVTRSTTFDYSFVRLAMS